MQNVGFLITRLIYEIEYSTGKATRHLLHNLSWDGIFSEIWVSVCGTVSSMLSGLETIGPLD